MCKRVIKFIANENIDRFSQRKFTEGKEYKVKQYLQSILGKKVYKIDDDGNGTLWIRGKSIERYNLTPVLGRGYHFQFGKYFRAKKFEKWQDVAQG
jgi:hypothetical protein